MKTKANLTVQLLEERKFTHTPARALAGELAGRWFASRGYKIWFHLIFVMFG